MKQRALKLVLSGLASLATAVSLTATTFAYVLMGNNVTVEQFDFNVEGQEGLLISLDNKNFSQDISSDQLKEHLAGSVDAFDKRTIRGTTIRQSAGSPVIINDKLVFEKEHINYDEASDTYTRTFDEAYANDDYITFDLYFKALNTKVATANYSLSLGEKTSIAATLNPVDIYSGFTTYLYNADTDKYEAKPYATESVIYQNAANAMRMAIYNEEANVPLKIYEVTDDKDIGSAAINGRTDAKHDPYSSVMINYYNQIFPLYPFKAENTTKVDSNGNLLKGVSGAEDGSAFNTIPQYGTKTGEEWIGENVGDFTLSEVMKITVYLWLEGWDADYLLGTPKDGSVIKCSLEFNLTAV